MVFPRENGSRSLAKIAALCALNVLVFQGNTVAADSCTLTVSQGDAAAGIQIVSDASCAAGGLGCINSVCRFCKLVDTFQSRQFNTCASYGATFTIPPVTTQSPTATCSVSDGDYAVGITAVTDATCSSGGLGCFSDHCRFCQFRTTPQSQHFNQCSGVTTVAPATTTATPVATTATPVATTATPVGTTATPVVTTATPVATTATSVATTATPEVTTPASTDAPATGSDLFGDTLDDGSSSGSTITITPTCSVSVASGDAAVGIRVITDSSCAAGGLGCINDVCRFCKVQSTIQSAHLSDCSGYSSYIPDTTATTAAPATTPAAPATTTATPATTTASPVTTTETPVTTTATPVSTDTIAPVTTAPVVTSAPSTTTCGQTVSPGDASVGIQIVADGSCAAGGVGCIDSVCRFCQVWSTTQSAHLTSCASIGYTSFTGAPATTTPVTTAPVTAAPVTTTPDTTAPVTTTPDTTAPVTTVPVTTAPVATSSAVTSAGCAAQVPSGDVNVGISAVLDAACASGGVGCFGSDNCRYCQVENTPQSAHLFTCSSLTTPSVKVMKAAARSGTDEESNVDSFLNDNRGLLIAAAGVGAAAMVAMMAFAVKRVTGRGSSVLSDEASDEEEAEMVAKVESEVDEVDAGNVTRIA